MKKIRKYLLALSLVTGIAFGASAKSGPWDVCTVITRLELDLMCDPSSPICCKFLVTTLLIDTNEIMQAGQYVYGWYLPLG
jgi:hypothetical protein